MPVRVLIVDDHESFRRLAARALVASGFAVVGEAVDAASAIRQTARLRPDLVLLDVMLPDRSGLEVARELVAEPDPPRVVLTSSGAGQTLARGCHGRDASSYRSTC